jgi:hypothetical protein
MKYINIKQQYNKLESLVFESLENEIKKSKIHSKFKSHVKVIKVNIFDYVELGLINDNLTFIDEGGYESSLYGECDLEDLIDILNNIE